MLKTLKITRTINNSHSGSLPSTRSELVQDYSCIYYTAVLLPIILYSILENLIIYTTLHLIKSDEVLGLDEVLIKSEDWIKFDQVLGLDEVLIKS